MDTPSEGVSNLLSHLQCTPVERQRSWGNCDMSDWLIFGEDWGAI